jgi:hypothetical protein
MKVKLSGKERAELQANWLAPLGSEQERQFLERWASHMEANDNDRLLVREWIDKPDDFGKRNAMFWHSAKREILADVVYDSAMKRHKKLLKKNEWLVACLMSQGFTQPEIAELLGVTKGRIENVVAAIKEIIIEDCSYAFDKVNSLQVGRWFLGVL